MNRLSAMAFFLSTALAFTQETRGFEGRTTAGINELDISGYEILQQASGNVNFDSEEDFLLVLAKANKRIVLLLISDAEHGYTISQNDNAVYYFGYDENFRESFVGAAIRDGKITIDHYGGFAVRWGRTTSFAYDAERKAVFFEKDQIQFLDSSDFNSVISEKTVTRDSVGCRSIAFSFFDIYDGIFAK
jgi:hypothetical protein